MNFLLRSTSSATHQPVIEQPSAALEPSAETTKPGATLERLIAEESFLQYPPVEDHGLVAGGSRGDHGIRDPSTNIGGSVMDTFSDVSEEAGWVTIPYKEIPDKWADAADISSLRSLDRSFVFPGEHVQVLACLAASKGKTGIVTPFKVAELLNRSGQRKCSDEQSSACEEGKLNPDDELATQSGDSPGLESLDIQKDVGDGESILEMEDKKRYTEELLCKFQKSHFFVRIAESDEPLWAKKNSLVTDPETNETKKRTRGVPCANAFIDRGDLNPNTSAGGIATSSAKCCALPNGDIVVALQVNVVDSPKDSVMEILQFEKHEDRQQPLESCNNSTHEDRDPYGDLLKWLIPLDNSIPQPSRSLLPPVNSSPGISSSSHRSALSSSSGSQLFSFGHFRSYSMSSLPPNSVPVPGPIKAQSSKPSFELEDWDSHSAQKLPKGQKSGIEDLLSFRGVELERNRFSVRCGVEGICIPGRRWRRKLEIIHPVEIHSSVADCNTDDLLCVQIKNVAPVHIPDIIIYVDAITIVFEEAGRSTTPTVVPTACIEAGKDHSLPNLTLRRGEEHSFIVKPNSSAGNTHEPSGGRKKQQSSRLSLPSVNFESRSGSTADEFAIMVSCRCNYTESRLFFKQRTNWKPRAQRDLMLSVASEMSGEPCGPHGRASQLPVQVLTLQASNLTSEDLSLTVLAPTSFASPPSVVSLNSTPISPLSPFLGFSEFTERVQSEKRGSMIRKLNSLPPIPLKSQTTSTEGGELRSNSFPDHSNPSDAVPKSGLGCTHLWLQSKVPLGCVPSRSTATIKVELLPLTDGIITLDTLQIHVKEKGRRYIPEQSLRINATSSISTGIF